jgi:hypothetical protein
VCVFILPTDEEFSEVRFKEREECAEERKEEIPQAGERETKKPHKKKGERDERGPRRGGGGRRIRIRHARSSGE